MRKFAGIVHDIDLKDDKSDRLEAVEFDTIVRALFLLLADDQKLLGQDFILFSDLYEKLNQAIQGKISDI